MKKKESTYFVSYIVPNGGPMQIGNATVRSDLTGTDLVVYIIDAVISLTSGAVVLNIVEV